MNLEMGIGSLRGMCLESLRMQRIARHKEHGKNWHELRQARLVTGVDQERVVISLQF